MTMKRALITGVTGQDGAYLSQLLLEKGYEVYGLLRRSASADVIDGRLRWLGIAGQIRMLDGDILDLSSVLRILREVKPDEVYNLGAQSFVKTSWTQPILTGQVTALGVGVMLEAVRLEVPQLGDPLQPRKPTARDRVCNPQGDRRSSAYQAWTCNGAAHGKPGRQAGLGARSRLRQGDAPDVAARDGG
jgi:hypothetical protein